MDNRSLTTARLTLRPVRAGDVPAIAAFTADWDVVKMLARWPYPGDPAQAEELYRRNRADPDGGFAVEYCGSCVGTIGAGPRIGFMFAREAWGLGLATEAVRAVTDNGLLRRQFPEMTADVFVDNPASMAVFRKCGWREIGTGSSWSEARKAEAPDLKFVVTPSDLAAGPLYVGSERLVIRPIGASERAAFHRMAARADIARMMGSIPHPLSLPEAETYLSERHWAGRVGFVAGVFAREGPLVGLVGCGGDPVSIMYFVDPAHWGKGYATEALKTFVAFLFQRFPIDHVVADAYVDNPASCAVLRKSGFQVTGEARCASKARDAADPAIVFRLDRPALLARARSAS